MKRIHLIGIGGTGLSAIAMVLAEKGYSVSGSDRTLSPLAKNLQARGVEVQIGHRAENIRGADLVVRSSAIPDDNIEVQAASAAGIPVLRRSDFLGQLTAGQVSIAVAGTAGKTTTTAMIAWMLTAIGQDPSFIVGGVLQNLGANAHAGSGPAFVIEADEYDFMFLGLSPWLAVVTNLEHDHPDCFPTLAEYQQAFLNFTRKIVAGGALLACLDDPGAAQLMRDASEERVRVLSYGLNPPAHYQARDLVANSRGGFDFTVVRSDRPGILARVSLIVPGEHNVRNALAALAVADQLGIPVQEAAGALGAYAGAGRRFEVRGEIAGIAVVDDYAHHPAKIRAALAAARSRYPGRRVWAVWQPHTYSRTHTLFDDFTTAFEDADQVIVTEIYAAREPSETFSAAEVVQAMRHPAARFIAGLPDVSAYLLSHLQPGDVLMVLSAGDADQVSEVVLAALQERTGQNA